MGRAWFAAPLVAVALFVVSAASASAADEGDSPMVVSADQSGSLGLVSTAQSDVEADPDRRLVGRESSARVDAVVIALWSIAAGMTVMLGIFLWHTSPRRRLRLARRRSTHLYDPEGEEPEDGSAEEGSAEEGSAEEGSAEEGSAEEGSAEEGSAEEGSAEEATEPAEDEPGQRSV